MDIQYPRRALRLLLRNPRVFLEQARHRVTGNGSSTASSMEGSAPAAPKAAPVDPALWVRRGFDRAAAEGFSRPVLFVKRGKSDAAGLAAAAGFANVPRTTLDRDTVAADVPFFDAGVLRAGRHDCVVVGPPGPGEYLNVLRALGDLDEPVPVFCDVSAFEMCGSDLPFWSRADATTIYLYNHFAEHFSVKDPLQVRFEVYNEGRLGRRFYRLMQPNQVLVFTEADLGLARKRGAFVRVRTWHPTLTRGRHQRFRLAADVYRDGSIATLHSAHDFGPPAHYHSEMTVPVGAGDDTTLSLPDYDNTTGRTESPHDLGLRVEVGDGDRARHAARPAFAAGALLEELSLAELARRAGPGASAPLVRYAYKGYGTAFWFRERQNGHGVQIAANHEVSAPWDCHVPRPATTAETARHRALEGQGLVFLPHALPLFPASTGLAAGFSFEHVYPRLTHLRALWFDRDGDLAAESEHPYGPAPSVPTFPRDLDAERARALEGGLLIVAPAWQRMGVLPAHLQMYSDLVVQDLASGDSDATELQDSWRNVAGYVKEYPRWTHPPEVSMARTNLLMRSVHKPGHRTLLLVLAASGDLHFNKRGTAEIKCYRPDGEALVATRPVRAWRHELWALDELFPSLPEFDAGGHGFLRVQSYNIDLNVYGIVRLPETGGVGLQHFWGY